MEYIKPGQFEKHIKIKRSVKTNILMSNFMVHMFRVGFLHMAKSK